MPDSLSLSSIEPNPEQPRQHFDQASLDELAQSMAANGLIIPILVRPAGDRFIIVHGERRYRAALSLGWQTIPAEVRDVTADEAQWLALVENVQRADLSPIEEARAYRKHLTGGITQQQLAERIGKGRTYVTQKLRLLKLSLDVQEALGVGSITEGHGRQLLRMKDAEAQSELCRRAVAEGWTVARTKLEVDQALKSKLNLLLPTTPAEVVKLIFESRGGIPGHAPYPEERLPEHFSSPVAIEYLPVSEIADLPYDYRTDGRDLEYVQWLSEIFETLPPIAVYRVNGRHVLADGKYRMMAAELLGLTEIECRIYESESLNEVSHYGAAANAVGGIPMRQKDYERLLSKGPSWVYAATKSWIETG